MVRVPIGTRFPNFLPVQPSVFRSFSVRFPGIFLHFPHFPICKSGSFSGHFPRGTENDTCRRFLKYYFNVHASSLSPLQSIQLAAISWRL